jgi:hypothetical protein
MNNKRKKKRMIFVKLILETTGLNFKYLNIEYLKKLMEWPPQKVGTYSNSCAMIKPFSHLIYFCSTN